MIKRQRKIFRIKKGKRHDKKFTWISLPPVLANFWVFELYHQHLDLTVTSFHCTDSCPFDRPSATSLFCSNMTGHPFFNLNSSMY